MRGALSLSGRYLTAHFRSTKLVLALELSNALTSVALLSSLTRIYIAINLGLDRIRSLSADAAYRTSSSFLTVLKAWGSSITCDQSRRNYSK